MSAYLTLVTGVTGLVGNNVVRMLLDRGQRVRALVRKNSARQPLEGLDVETAVGDVCDAESVRKACDGVRVVIHAAGHVQIGSTHLDLHRAVNVEGTRHVAQAAREAGARMVHVSSVDAVGEGSPERPADEDSPLGDPHRCAYAISKREAEQAVQKEVDDGLDAVIVNPGYMIGPNDWKPSSGRMVIEVAKGKAWLAPRGSLSLCDVRDVTAGILAAVEAGQCGRRYILAGKTISYIDAFRLFASVTGGRRPLGRVGPVAAWIGGRIGDLEGAIVGREPIINSAAVAVAALPRAFSSRRAMDELGYAIRPEEESVRDTWQWFKNHGYL